MAKLSNENKGNAKNIFKANPKLDTLFMNDKGEFFTTKNLAQNSVKKVEDITEIKRESVEEATQEQAARPNVAKTVKAIKEVTTLDGLAEFEDDDRKTVQDALAERKKELETPAPETVSDSASKTGADAQGDTNTNQKQ